MDGLEPHGNQVFSTIHALIHEGRAARMRARFSDHFNRAAFPTTLISLHAIAAAAIAGPYVPNNAKAASGMATTL